MAAKPKTTKTEPALLLTLGGAPTSPHSVTGAPGFFRPDRPTPVGGPGEATLSQAKQLDDDPGVPLKLVRVAASEVASLRLAAENDRRADSGLPPRNE